MRVEHVGRTPETPPLCDPWLLLPNYDSMF
ncbi:MAG: hypothetical protein ACI87E_003307 [Mariniblastus sp.]